MTYGTQHDKETEVIKKIVERGVEVLEPFERLSLRIFCRPRSTASLIMRNNTTAGKSLAETTNVVYKFKCSVGACQHRDSTYIGLTTSTLRRRMQAHRNNGGINNHYTQFHDRKPLLVELLENTTIIHRETQKHRLQIAEAVSISLNHPVLNTQTEHDYVLPSARRRAITIRRNEPIVTEEPQDEIEPLPHGAHGAAPRAAPSTTPRNQDAPAAADAGGGEQRRRLRPRHTRPAYAE